MLSPDDVTAVIVTRGDVDVSAVVESLIFDDVIVLDNSAQKEDLKTAALLTACDLARHKVIFAIDDDIVHSRPNQEAILSAYTPGVLTGCMWPEWSDGARAQGIQGGYDDLVFYGSGSVFDRQLPAAAANAYCAKHPFDDFMALWFSCIFGIIAPNRQLDLRFDALPHAEGPTRMADLPNGPALKREAIERSRRIRDARVETARFAEFCEKNLGRLAA